MIFSFDYDKWQDESCLMYCGSLCSKVFLIKSGRMKVCLMYCGYLCSRAFLMVSPTSRLVQSWYTCIELKPVIISHHFGN